MKTIKLSVLAILLSLGFIVAAQSNVEKSELVKIESFSIKVEVDSAEEVESTFKIEDFVEILNENERTISVKNFEKILRDMLERLESKAGDVEMTFPYFVNKRAPISGVESLLDYEVTFIGSIKDNQFINQIKVIIPVTSLCPCSKKISDYGAHNKRSHVTVTIETNDFVWIEDIIELVEKNASSELYGLLKRPDEKYVTEKAYDNPKFVEDMVRDIATDLNQNNKITSYTVESENFESIHNHSAYAMIQSS